MRVVGRHLAAENLRRGAPGELHFRDQIGREDIGIFELLVEVAGEQQYGVFQFAFAVAQRALAELADDERRADGDRRDQKNATKDEPEDRTSPEGGGAVMRRDRGALGPSR
ncbi:MAG: hypothetical protein E6G79_05680 [Alphaproteobacteria bacterium]|nr:MAG: hypothetical protein E6G79_05680 [Alphaproteobacteria bacterium]